MNRSTTKALLAAGAVAGPVYIAVGLVEILIRPGFDVTRHELSLMSLGKLGWIQIANFLVTGLLVIAGALGMRRVLHPGRGGTWGPLLLAIYGLGLICAGIFVPDPMNGFPPGLATPSAISWHAILHFVSGAVGFVGLIAACFVLARRFAARKERGWAAYSLITGVLFLGAFVGIASGSTQAAIVLAFYAAVLIGWTWISVIAARLITS
ncbi:MAG: DUF998 domain-containing protein [Chloroflexi bacterium]|nr:MAG: DUF998 domain-containing protein [Chloroflexota bacterium]